MSFLGRKYGETKMGSTIEKKTIEIRNLLIDKLKEIFKLTAVVELNGINFASADIALNDKDDNPEIYRISVIKYNQQRNP